MRVVVPLNDRGELVSTHFQIDSMKTVMAQLGEDGHHYIHVNQNRWRGLITGPHGAAWLRSNPHVKFD